MKKYLLLFFLLSSSTFAKTGYDILIDENGYDLRIELDFSNFQSLFSIRQALIKSDVISQLSPNVKSVTNTGTRESYDSLMIVKSLGVKSELLSKCTETFSKTSWSRRCVLQTDKLDSGKYMAWKNDQVVCTKKDLQETVCLFSIKGKTKPLKILGISILSERAFAVKAKAQALNNFFKIYYYVKNFNISTALALNRFETSKIHVELASFEEEALSKLKKELTYKRSFSLTE